MAKIYSEAYGCSSNFADQEMALGLLKNLGFEFVEDPEESDLNIIFTCTVKTPTVQRMIYRITELTKLKKPLIVAGCMPKTDRKIIERINPGASMLGPDSIEKIFEIVRKTLAEKKIVFTEDSRKPKLCLPRVRRNPLIDIVPISIGCMSDCSYCSVKFARGKLFSYPIQMILEEIKGAVESGCREIHITSQDNSCYGFDTGKRLYELLEEICGIRGKFFVRVGMMNPLYTKKILDGLIDAYRDEKIFKFLHLPVQSGSDRILEMMNRGYKVKDFLEIVGRFREEFPQLTLSTDVIVGFPSETENDFRKTFELIEKIRPDIVNLSKFGARAGTEAAEMKKLDEKTVKGRSSILHWITKQIALEKNKKWVGREGETLVDEIGTNESFVGRNIFYKPIVIKTKKNILGRFIRSEIADATENFLISKNFI